MNKSEFRLLRGGREADLREWQRRMEITQEHRLSILADLASASIETPDVALDFGVSLAGVFGDYQRCVENLSECNASGILHDPNRIQAVRFEDIFASGQSGDYFPLRLFLASLIFVPKIRLVYPEDSVDPLTLALDKARENIESCIMLVGERGKAFSRPRAVWAHQEP